MLLSLPGFHYPHYYSINDILPFYSYFFVISLLLLILAQFLLLPSLSWYKRHSYVIVLEILEHLYLLIGIKLWLLHVFFVENLLLGIAEIDQCWSQLTLWYCTVILNFIKG